MRYVLRTSRRNLVFSFSKMWQTRLLCIFTAVLLCNTARGGILKGMIRDTAGIVLPAATVYIEGTTIGTTSNSKGEYELPLGAGAYVAKCTFVGYSQRSYKFIITGNEVVTHDFTLLEQNLELGEFTIHAGGEDAAYKIMRAAIKRREQHLGVINNFQTSVYTKAVVKSRKLPDKFMGEKIKTPDLDVDTGGKGVLYLSEQYSDYYKSGSKQQTVIHSVHQSGNPSGFGMAQLPSVISFYNNSINLFTTRNAVSPLSDNALYYYKYKLLGTFTENGVLVNSIQVIPKREFEPCFSGTIYITDDDYAIHSLDLRLTKQNGLDVLDTVQIRQIYLPLQGNVQVIKSQNIYLTAKVFSFDVTAGIVSVYNNQKVNEPLPDSLFSDNIVSRYDKNATRNTDSFWNNNRPVMLDTEEKRNFRVQETLNKKTTTLTYRDSIRKKENVFKVFNVLTGKKWVLPHEKNTVAISPALFFVNYNAVEGLNFTPRITWKYLRDSFNSLTTFVDGRYGCSNRHFNVLSKGYFTHSSKENTGKKWGLGAELGTTVAQYADAEPVYPLLNTITALIWQENDLKLYEKTTGTLFFRENYGNGWIWATKLSYQERSPLTNTSFYSFASAHTDFENNLPAPLAAIAPMTKHIALLYKINLSWTPGFTYIQYPDYISPVSSKNLKFTLEYSKGIPGIAGSKTDFDKMSLKVENYHRLGLLGTLAYNMTVGGFLSAKYAPVPDLMFPMGNRGLGIASPYLGSFQFAPFYAFGNKEPLFSEAHIEYKLKGLVTNKIPGLRNATMYLVAGCNSFYANAALHYTEVFGGLENIGIRKLHMFRLDFVQSWDSFSGRNSGLRLGISGSGFRMVFREKDDF
jgi:Family of unknown function (DUF5686)/CarboxypepD_reg-like domain